MKRTYFILIHIVLILLIVIIFQQRKKYSSPQSPVQEGDETTEDEIVPVITGHPVIGDVEYRVNLTGEIKGEEEAMVFSDVPGRFLKYLIREGEYVKKRTPVALVEREIPGLEFEPVQVEAPISGVVSRLPLETGQAITPLAPIARVAKTGRVKVLFEAPEIYAAGVTAGKEVIIEIASLKKSFKGKIVWVATFLDPIARTVSCYALIDNSKRVLKPGMFANVELVVEERKKVLTLPSHAILGFKDKHVFVAEGGRARRRNVRVGLDDGTNAEILDGVIGEDMVITVGQEVVEEGDTLDISVSGGGK